ncbi:3-dehydroquinate synthase [Polaribacter pacificus]|uniref:3-dehydroquinate synthase n=1 Tax=Polaribacter pacificus TaxID=1775173 RepID=A0A917HZ20_9FLAO|nr:3-dehydroquinate synthase [Polaribacter pacificus]GGG98923.1 3-dehydroquinate synthase [Polaribacter pacificus]
MKSIQASSYPIHFQELGYKSLETILAQNTYSSLFILVDENTMEYCYPKFMANLHTDLPIEVIEIEAGEIHKNLETCMGVWSALTELNADRHSVLITLGGGVITDLGGFVAATYKRGIDFINVPTTLLSMVDASVGGKTGVDLGVLKNQIGLFANPQMVLVDPEYLETVTAREIRSGTAEIIKYGITYDQNLYQQIKKNNKLNITKLIHKSIEIKNEVVLQDPKEKHLRKILNFGHTIGHAVESYFLESQEKENLTHGEAIAIGMVCETYISSVLFDFPKSELQEFKEMILSIYGKIPIDTREYSAIMDLLKHDKKNNGGQVNFVLLNDIEKYEIDCKVPEDLIIASLNYYRS